MRACTSRVAAGLVAAALLVCGLAACGGSDSASGRTLNWYIFNEPSGGPQGVAERCSKQSGGRYDIEFQYLPSRADQQREQLVRRLGAEDDTIDLIGMDIIWTGEFANAGWLEPVPAEHRDKLTEGVFDSVLETARFEDRLYNVPIWSNTELLWYRKDRAKQPPKTWDEMLEAAERIGAKGKIQVQANRYEGLVVWTNAMIESAGTSILSAPDEMDLEQGPTEKALATMGKMANSSAAPNDIDTSNEDTARLGFEAGDSAFMINYPFVYPSAKENAPDVFKQMGAAKFPGIDADSESKPPLGGINVGVSKFSKKKDRAFEAIECLIKPENQLEIAKKGGLPPVREDLYERKEIDEIYPGFADIVHDSIADAAPRPAQSPAYQDLSLAIQRAMHPVSDIDADDPTSAYDRLKDYVEQAIERKGLL